MIQFNPFVFGFIVIAAVAITVFEGLRRERQQHSYGPRPTSKPFHPPGTPNTSSRASPRGRGRGRYVSKRGRSFPVNQDLRGRERSETNTFSDASTNSTSSPTVSSECIVCGVLFDGKDEEILTCKHRFHKNCLYVWRRDRGTFCPECVKVSA